MELNDKQKQLLKEFAEAGGGTIDDHEESFFAKMKRAFKGE